MMLFFTKIKSPVSLAISVPDPMAGDRFQWQRTDPQGEDARGTATEPTLEITGLAATDRPCLDVWLVRANGQRSADRATACSDS